MFMVVLKENLYNRNVKDTLNIIINFKLIKSNYFSDRIIMELR